MRKRVNYQSINLNTKSSLNTQIISAYFKITSNCMLNCPFCSQGINPKKTIALDDAKIVLKKLKRLGVKSVTYTGGEPLLYKNLYELLKYGKSIGFEQIIVSNGLMLNKINPVIFKYIDAIGISLHGNELIHDKIVNSKGMFKKVVDNIDYIIGNYKDIIVNINCTLTEKNMDYNNMEFLTNFAKRRNIRLCFGRLNYIGLSKNSDIIDANRYLSNIYRLKNLYDKIEISNCISLCNQDEKYNHMNHSCGAGQTMIAIEPNGDVKICASSSVVVANILKGSPNKIIKSKKLKKFRQLQWIPMSCSVCKKFALCKGGCHTEVSGEFYKDNCDALLSKKYEDTWNKIKNKKLKFKNISITKQKVNKFILIKKPISVTNKMGIKIIKELDGTNTLFEIKSKHDKITNCKEFLVLLYIEGVLM